MNQQRDTTSTPDEAHTTAGHQLENPDLDGTDLDQVGGGVTYSPQFQGGVRVAVGDINGDGRDDIVVGASSGLSG